MPEVQFLISELANESVQGSAVDHMYYLVHTLLPRLGLLRFGSVAGHRHHLSYDLN